MKTRLGSLTLAVALGVVTVAGATGARAGQGEQGRTEGGQPPMSEMMRGPMTEMMRGMPMGQAREVLGRERPLLSLALRHRAELGLSADQVTALEGLIERFRKDAEARLADIEAAERELAALFEAESPDLGQVQAKVLAVEKLRADLRIARIKTIVEGRAGLTAEQRKKLEELVAAGPEPRGEPRSEAPEGQRSRGMEEMHRFMQSDRAPQAMAAMMEMARRMGDGDVMLGMVRMMEMMSGMGGMMGGPPHPAAPEEPK